MDVSPGSPRCLQLPGALAAFAGITNRGDLLLEDDGALWLTAPGGLPPFFQKKQGPPKQASLQKSIRWRTEV